MPRNYHEELSKNEKQLSKFKEEYGEDKYNALLNVYEKIYKEKDLDVVLGEIDDIGVEAFINTKANEEMSKNREYKDFSDYPFGERQKKHITFGNNESELEPVKNVKLIHFKNENGNNIEGQLVVGEVENKEKIYLERTREIEVKRDLGKFKKFLAYLGIIKSTEKITVNEIFSQEAVRKEEKIIGYHELGNFSKNENLIENFLDELEWHEGKVYAYDIAGKKIGDVDTFGKLILDEGISFNETILQKDGKIFGIEKNGKFLDLEGNTLPNQNQFTRKNNRIYNKGEDVKYFHEDENINTSKGVANLDKKPSKSALKVSKEAKKIGENLRKKQEHNNFAGINKKAQKAKLTKVKAPTVPNSR